MDRKEFLKSSTIIYLRFLKYLGTQNNKKITRIMKTISIEDFFTNVKL